MPIVARIQFGRRDIVNLTDPAEAKALKEALVVRRIVPAAPGNDMIEQLFPFSPWVTSESVRMFLLGRRHALGQSLGDLQVHNQMYEDRIRERAAKRVVIDNGKVTKSHYSDLDVAQALHDHFQRQQPERPVTEEELEQALKSLARVQNTVVLP